jgi:dolichol-phosphate mannosyltransferase
MKTNSIGIVIPTFNESESITLLLTQVSYAVTKLGKKVAILVMDDNSPDGTSKIVRDFIEFNDNSLLSVKLRVREKKMGLASAYKQGFATLKDDCEYLMSMDADLSHKPEYLLDFWSKATEGKDMVIGSRNIRGGSVEDWALHRKLISKLASVYCRIILWTNIHDFTGGYNLYKSSIFDTLSFSDIQAEGYLFQIEMKYRISQLGFSFCEIPIVFPDRIHGKSKFSKKIIFEAFLGVWKLKFNLK